MECRVKFSIFEIAQKDCSSHVWWLLWIHGRTESVEPPGIGKLFPKWSGNTKEDSRWSDQQHWITIAGGSNSITSDLRSGLRLHPPPTRPASPQPASWAWWGKRDAGSLIIRTLSLALILRGSLPSNLSVEIGSFWFLEEEKKTWSIFRLFIFLCLFDHFQDGPGWLITLKSEGDMYVNAVYLFVYYLLFRRMIRGICLNAIYYFWRLMESI